MPTNSPTRVRAATALEREWAGEPRWQGIERPYAPADVVRLRGSVVPEHTLARLGAERLWELLHGDGRRPRARRDDRRPGRADGARRPAGDLPLGLAGRGRREPRRPDVPRPEPLPGEQRARRSCAGSTTRCCAPTRSTAPRAATRPTGSSPIVADAEAGFGGPLNAFELMKAMIEAGAAGVHFEDQLAAEKKCGHLGGKVLVPTSQFVRTLAAARLAADVLDVPTVLVARTDALSAALLTSDVDPADARVRHRRADGRGLLPRPRRARGRDRALARLRAVRRRALVRDLDARPRRGDASSRPRSTSGSRASCSPTTARRRSTGSAHLDDTRDRGVPGRRSASSATASSSSRSPASTR